MPLGGEILIASVNPMPADPGENCHRRLRRIYLANQQIYRVNDVA
jgi:hypothetical protein